MKRLIAAAGIIATLAGPTIVRAQVDDATKKAIQAVAVDWNKAWADRNVDGYMAAFGKPAGMYIVGGNLYSPDSLRATLPNWWKPRSDEHWTVDDWNFVPLGNNRVLLQMTYSGHYTLPTGVTWEYNRSAFITALMEKQGGAWKIMTYQNSASGKQVKK